MITSTPGSAPCDQGALALHAGGDLPPGKAREIDRHLATCQGCRALLAELREDREALAELADERPAGGELAALLAGVRQDVLATLAEEPELREPVPEEAAPVVPFFRGRGARGQWGALAASLLVALLLGALLWQTVGRHGGLSEEPEGGSSSARLPEVPPEPPEVPGTSERAAGEGAAGGSGEVPGTSGSPAADGPAEGPGEVPGTSETPVPEGLDGSSREVPGTSQRAEAEGLAEVPGTSGERPVVAERGPSPGEPNASAEPIEPIEPIEPAEPAEPAESAEPAATVVRLVSEDASIVYYWLLDGDDAPAPEPSEPDNPAAPTSAVP